MFGISGIEIVIIAIFAFLVFGPDKLPGVIKNVTHIWNQLKGLRKQADQVIKAEVVEPLKDIEASVNPFVEEGKSVTDKLAGRLGLKPDAPKKDEKKTAEVKNEVKKASAPEDKYADAKIAAAAAGAAATAAMKAEAESKAATGADSSTATQQKAEPAAGVDPEPQKPSEPEQKKKIQKPKAESFAEKKAALERAQREKLAAASDGTSAEAPASAVTDAPKTTAEAPDLNKTAGA